MPRYQCLYRMPMLFHPANSLAPGKIVWTRLHEEITLHVLYPIASTLLTMLLLLRSQRQKFWYGARFQGLTNQSCCSRAGRDWLLQKPLVEEWKDPHQN